MAVHLPSISITFRQLAGTFIQRSARGVAVLIVKDDTGGRGRALLPVQRRHPDPGGGSLPPRMNSTSGTPWGLAPAGGGGQNRNLRAAGPGPGRTGPEGTDRLGHGMRRGDQGLDRPDQLDQGAGEGGEELESGDLQRLGPGLYAHRQPDQRQCGLCRRPGQTDGRQIYPQPGRPAGRLQRGARGHQRPMRQPDQRGDAGGPGGRGGQREIHPHQRGRPGPGGGWT